MDDDGIDKYSRDLHVAGIERTGGHDPLDLGDHFATVPPSRLGQQQPPAYGRFLLHGQVAVFVRRRCADEGNIDGNGPVEEILAAADGNALDQFVGGNGIQRAAALPWIEEGIEPHRGHDAGTSGCRRLQQGVHDANGEVVGLHLVVVDTADELRHTDRPYGPADHTPYQTGLSEQAGPVPLFVAAANGVELQQIARFPCGAVPVEQGLDQEIRFLDPAGTADRKGRARRHEAHGLGRRDDFRWLGLRRHSRLSVTAVHGSYSECR